MPCTLYRHVHLNLARVSSSKKRVWVVRSIDFSGLFMSDSSERARREQRSGNIYLLWPRNRVHCHKLFAMNNKSIAASAKCFAVQRACVCVCVCQHGMDASEHATTNSQSRKFQRAFTCPSRRELSACSGQSRFLGSGQALESFMRSPLARK